MRNLQDEERKMPEENKVQPEDKEEDEGWLPFVILQEENAHGHVGEDLEELGGEDATR